MDKVLVCMLDKRQGDRRKRRENHGSAWAVGFDVGINRRDSLDPLVGLLQGLTDGIANQGQSAHSDGEQTQQAANMLSLGEIDGSQRQRTAFE